MPSDWKRSGTCFAFNRVSSSPSFPKISLSRRESPNPAHRICREKRNSRNITAIQGASACRIRANIADCCGFLLNMMNRESSQKNHERFIKTSNRIASIFKNKLHPSGRPRQKSHWNRPWPPRNPPSKSKADPCGGKGYFLKPETYKANSTWPVAPD
jgi:hypothetical protein